MMDEWMPAIEILLIGAVWIGILQWFLHRKTERLRRMACMIMGLPMNTSMKEFEKIHRALMTEKPPASDRKEA